jgi:Holliday junction resolvase
VKEQLELFIIIPASAKYYQWIKNHPDKRRNYKRGTSFEQRIVEHFRKRGWFAKRNWGSQGTRIEGKSFKDDGFAFKDGIVWTAKWRKRGETRPEDHPEEVKLMRELARMFNITPVFACVTKDRKIRLVNLNTMEDIKIGSRTK